jgi:ATP-dependent Lon protease
MATSLASALTGRPVRRDVGMSGEITLRGRVLPIGGVREKVLAAYRLKMGTVLLPVANRKDMVEVPKDARDSLKVHFVGHMDQVLELALHSKPATGRRARRSATKGSRREDQAGRVATGG